MVLGLPCNPSRHDRQNVRLFIDVPLARPHAKQRKVNRVAAVRQLPPGSLMLRVE